MKKLILCLALILCSLTVPVSAQSADICPAALQAAIPGVPGAVPADTQPASCLAVKQCANGSSVVCESPNGQCATGSNYVECNGARTYCMCFVEHTCPSGETLACEGTEGTCQARPCGVSCDGAVSRCQRCFFTPTYP